MCQPYSQTQDWAAIMNGMQPKYWPTLLATVGVVRNADDISQTFDSLFTTRDDVLTLCNAYKQQRGWGRAIFGSSSVFANLEALSKKSSYTITEMREILSQHFGAECSKYLRDPAHYHATASTQVFLKK